MKIITKTLVIKLYEIFQIYHDLQNAIWAFWKEFTEHNNSLDVTKSSNLMLTLSFQCQSKKLTQTCWLKETSFCLLMVV